MNYIFRGPLVHGSQWFVRAKTSIIFICASGVDIVGQLNLLSEALAQRLPDLTPLQRGQLGWYLADTCVGSHRLLAAVASPAAAANVTTVQGHLEVQVPPTPLPLAQVTHYTDPPLGGRRVAPSSKTVLAVFDSI